MNVAIDIGNSLIKAGWFEGSVLREQFQLGSEQEIASLLQQTTSVEAIILSSVGPPNAASTRALEISDGSSVPIVVLDGHTPLPFVNTYHTPTTLGTDRIAAVAGVQRIHPKQNSLVVDVGTCITYDIIDQEGYYRGGLISPGVRMRLRAMHTFTARLPLIEWKPDSVAVDNPSVGRVSSSTSQSALIERSTADGLRSGAVRGAAAEIGQMIRMYADKFSDLHVVLCGGDASYLLPYIYQDHPVAGSSATKVVVTEVPELILIGLNSILEYNVNQKN